MCSKDLQKETKNMEPLDKYRDSLDTVYDIMSGLDKYSTVEVLFYAAQMLSVLIDSPDVAVYTVANADYARLFAATSQNARKLGNSIKYTTMNELYDQLTDGHIYINKSGDTDLPLLAGAVYSKDEMQIILMFWGIPDEELTSRLANRLTVIISLIQNAILRAKLSLSSFRRRHHMEGTNVLDEKSFTALVKTFLEAKEKGLTECTLLEIVMGYEDYEQISLHLACNIRQSDYMGIMEGGKLYILLSNTDATNAEVVRVRLHKLGYNSVLKETMI
ncbi:hypothetical protein FMM74_006825 [Lachnospiraceae bacterium MD308]|nr:hypothetical protein [Lachnospiraceae bacterium MD308]